MLIRKGISIPLLIAASLCLAGCNGQRRSSGVFRETAFEFNKSIPAGSGKEPLTIHLVVNDTYCKKTACACIQNLAAREYEEVVTKLKRDFNIDLRLTYCLEEKELEGMLKSGRYDGAICKPWFAFRLMTTGDFRFTRVADVLDPFDNGLLGSMFIVKKESLLTKPADIAGKILAIGQDDSYEKYHMAMALLDKEGIKPSKIFRRSICSEGINMLLDNQADVAVVSDYALIASCAVDFAKPDAFRTILKTADSPLCSVILDLNRVKNRDAARLQAALLAIAGKNCPESFASNGFVKPIGWIPEPYHGTTH